MLVISPTRELAVQTKDESRKYAAGTGLASVVAYGGVEYNEQLANIRAGCDILIATPGRLLDYVEKHIIGLNQVSIILLCSITYDFTCMPFLSRTSLCLYLIVVGWEGCFPS